MHLTPTLCCCDLQLFRLPIEKARAALRVSKNAFRTLLLQRGYKRWPQRQLMGLANLRHKTAEDATLTEPVRSVRGRVAVRRRLVDLFRLDSAANHRPPTVRHTLESVKWMALVFPASTIRC